MANCTARHRAALQLTGMEWRPEALHEGSAKRGSGSVGDTAIAFDVYGGRPYPASGSYLPAEGIAPPCAVAFRVVTSHPVP